MKVFEPLPSETTQSQTGESSAEEMSGFHRNHFIIRGIRSNGVRPKMNAIRSGATRLLPAGCVVLFARTFSDLFHYVLSSPYRRPGPPGPRTPVDSEEGGLFRRRTQSSPESVIFLRQFPFGSVQATVIGDLLQKG